MSELPHVARLVRTAPKTDVAVLLLTFLLTVFVDLVVAVNVGVIVAALLFMRRMADAVSVEQHVDTTATSYDILGPKPDSGVVIYSIEGPLFFGAAEKLERTLAHIQRPATTLILRMGSVPFIDATGIHALEEMVGDFKRHALPCSWSNSGPMCDINWSAPGLSRRSVKNTSSTRWTMRCSSPNGRGRPPRRGRPSMFETP